MFFVKKGTEYARLPANNTRIVLNVYDFFSSSTRKQKSYQKKERNVNVITKEMRKERKRLKFAEKEANSSAIAKYRALKRKPTIRDKVLNVQKEEIIHKKMSKDFQLSQLQQLVEFCRNDSTETTDNGGGDCKELKRIEDIQKFKALQELQKRKNHEHHQVFHEGSRLHEIFGSISLGELNDLPYAGFSNIDQISLIHSPVEEQQFIEEFRNAKIIGLDTESRPSIRSKVNPICLIQIATSNRSLLYRIKKNQELPPGLLEILNNPLIIKIGHSVHDDIKQLAAENKITEVHSYIDTYDVARKLGCRKLSLKVLCEIFLNKSICKTSQISNWQAPILSDDQILYAATDAWAPREVLLKMSKFLQGDKHIFLKNFPRNPSSKSNAVNAKIIVSLLENIYAAESAP